MTVICPSCEARFRDPPAEINEKCVLQCGKCEHSWHPERLAITDAPGLAPELEDIADTNPRKLSNDTTQLDGANRVSGKLDPELRPLLVPLITLACLTVLATGVGLRNTVMHLAPPTVAIYQMAGLVSASPGLEIGNIVTTKVDKDGIRQLIIEGEIQNVADNTVPVPPVKLTMRGKANGNIQAWTVAANKARLKAGESSRFTAITSEFPRDMVDVNVEFAPMEVQD